MLAALVEALAAVGTARGILRLARDSSVDAPWIERSLSAQLLVGLPIYGTLLWLAGLFSTSAIAVGAITLPLALFAIASLATRRADRIPPRTRDAFGALALATAGAFSFLFAQLPSFSLDELAYHLAVPMQWIIAGRVESYPLLSHAWFPFGLESADLFALRLLGHDGGVASHFVRLFCGVALAVLLVRRLTCESATPLLFAAGIFTAPALLVTVGWSWSDVPLVGMVVVLFLALEELAQTGRASALAGLAVTAGLLTKYTFVLVALLLGGVALLALDRAKRGLLIRAAAIGGAAGSIFWVRNALLTANPFEPLFTEGTGDIGFRWTGSALATVGSYVFDARILDEALGVSLLLLAAFSFARVRALLSLGSSIALLSACAVIAPLTPSARVFLPFLVVPALVGAQAVARLAVWPRRLVALAIGVGVTAQLAVTGFLLAADDPIALLTGRSSVASWLVAKRPATSNVLWIDAALPAHSRTLVLGVQELFWFDHEVRGGGNNDGARVAAYLRAGDPQRLRDRLRRDGITHVALDRGLVLAPSPDFKRHERETLLDPQTAETLADFLLTQRLVAAKGSMMVFELK
jgi:hypothetical protein